MRKGTLYIVSTPIGNLEDITLRAIRVLKEADFIAAEDTRRTRILLDRYGIKKKLISFYSYNKLIKKDRIVGLLKEGRNIALVSDAGTPGISDPGFSLIKSAIENTVPIEAIPGPTALITALVLSGKPTNKFVFEGFLPSKPSKRRKRLKFLKNEERTAIIYESSHRITRLLGDMLDIFGDREIALARELTKKFEEIRRDRTSALLEHFSEEKPRGEFIVVIGGSDE
ncbi:MAG: 16S rRNA (cytidine(1402)-2'-O)-methyltransferase [Candidatus Omnitrophota bacterium]